MPPVSAHCQTLEPLRTVNQPIRPFIGDLWLQFGIPEDAFLDLDIGLSGKWIGYRWEIL